jgi:hypothetical protein
MKASRSLVAMRTCRPTLTYGMWRWKTSRRTKRSDYDAQGGWQLHFFSDHAPVEPFPGHPLMGGLDLEGRRRP